MAKCWKTPSCPLLVFYFLLLSLVVKWISSPTALPQTIHPLHKHILQYKNKKKIQIDKSMMSEYILFMSASSNGASKIDCGFQKHYCN